MKRSHLIIIAAAVIVVLAVALLTPKDTARNGAPTPAETAKTDAPGADVPETGAKEGDEARDGAGQQSAATFEIGGVAVDPLCFVTRESEDPHTYPVEGCDDDAIDRDTAAQPDPLGPGFVSTGYVSIVPNPETNSEERFAGLIGYSYLGEIDGNKAVLVIENSGGSGLFSTLMLLAHDAAANRLKPVKTYASGDRCNGGVTGGKIVDGKVVYERAVTALDMMSLTGEPGRATLQSEAARQLPSCAICCYGDAQFEEERFTGISFDPRLATAIQRKTYEQQGGAEQCFDNLIKQNVVPGKTYMDAEAFTAFVREVENTCLGGTKVE